MTDDSLQDALMCEAQRYLPQEIGNLEISDHEALLVADGIMGFAEWLAPQLAIARDAAMLGAFDVLHDEACEKDPCDCQHVMEAKAKADAWFERALREET